MTSIRAGTIRACLRLPVPVHHSERAGLSVYSDSGGYARSRRTEWRRCCRAHADRFPRIRRRRSADSEPLCAQDEPGDDRVARRQRQQHVTGTDSVWSRRHRVCTLINPRDERSSCISTTGLVFGLRPRALHQRLAPSPGGHCANGQLGQTALHDAIFTACRHSKRWHAAKGDDSDQRRLATTSHAGTFDEVIDIVRGAPVLAFRPHHR